MEAPEQLHVLHVHQHVAQPTPWLTTTDVDSVDCQHPSFQIDDKSPSIILPPSCAPRLATAAATFADPRPSGGSGTQIAATPLHQLTALSRPAHCSASDLDLPSYDQLAVLRGGPHHALQQHGLHRPDSVITTSSIVSSEIGDDVPPPTTTMTTATTAAVSVSAVAPLPDVYTISGLYGSAVDHSPSSSSVSSVEQAAKTHKRSTSTTATSIMRSCQNMTHKRSHSHTVGYHAGNSSFRQNHHYHKRVSSAGGFAAGHRRTASGALIEVLDKMTGGALEIQQTTTDFLKDIQRQNQERKLSRQEQEAQLMDDDFSDLRDCGYFACKPACAQPLASIKVFVFLLSLLVILQQSLSSGYLNSVITTIEKRYEIPSSVSGIIASMYEIGNVFTVIFVSYLGSRRHIPAFIGVGAIVMGFSSILFSLPHFLSESYSSTFNFGANISDENICQISYSEQKSVLDQFHLGSLDPLIDPEKGLSSPPLAPHNQQFNREDNCIKETSWSAAFPIFIFMLAQLLLGCSGSPIFTLGTTYIDDHVKRDTASVYLGVIYSMVAFGPVLGFLLGAYLLSLYVDTFSEDVSMLMIDSKSRHWVGMWWGGFLVCGVCILLISIPFFAFPKELKREKRRVYLEEKFKNPPTSGVDSAAVGTTTNGGGKGSGSPTEGPAEPPTENTYGQSLKDLPMCIWKLITNFIYMVTCMGSCAELVIVSGFIVFLPKYLETQFSLSKSEANLLTGGTAIPGACIGILFGGYILKRLQLSPRGAIQLVLGCNFLCLACYAMLFFFGCDNIKMAGVTSPFSRDSNEKFQVNLTASCNFGCSCDINDVQPVCGNNGLTYFSPCHAGCTSLLSSDHSNYTNCKCVTDNFEDDDVTEMGSSTDDVTKVPVASAGPCYTHCQMLLPFMVLLFFMTLMVAITQMPLLMVVLRSVAEEEKAFALGIQFVIFRLFGYIPSPIIFGNVIDSTCLLWKQTCEGSQGGRCLVYDIVAFRYKYVGICAGIKSIAFLIFLLDWWLIRRKQMLEEELGLSVDEVVDGIVSMEKIFEADVAAGPPSAVGDLEEGDQQPGAELISPSKQPMIIPASSIGPE